MKISVLLPLAFFSALASCSQNKPVEAKPHLPAKEFSKYSQATFAAGCFWHEEAMFESIKGVKEAVSGYAGGPQKTRPTKALKKAPRAMQKR